MLHPAEVHGNELVIGAQGKSLQTVTLDTMQSHEPIIDRVVTFPFGKIHSTTYYSLLYLIHRVLPADSVTIQAEARYIPYIRANAAEIHIDGTLVIAAQKHHRPPLDQ